MSMPPVAANPTTQAEAQVRASVKYPSPLFAAIDARTVKSMASPVSSANGRSHVPDVMR